MGRKDWKKDIPAHTVSQEAMMSLVLQPTQNNMLPSPYNEKCLDGGFAVIL